MTLALRPDSADLLPTPPVPLVLPGEDSGGWLCLPALVGKHADLMIRGVAVVEVRLAMLANFGSFWLYISDLSVVVPQLQRICSALCTGKLLSRAIALPPLGYGVSWGARSGFNCYFIVSCFIIAPFFITPSPLDNFSLLGSNPDSTDFWTRQHTRNGLGIDLRPGLSNLCRRWGGQHVSLFVFAHFPGFTIVLVSFSSAFIKSPHTHRVGHRHDLDTSSVHLRTDPFFHTVKRLDLNKQKVTVHSFTGLHNVPLVAVKPFHVLDDGWSLEESTERVVIIGPDCQNEKGDQGCYAQAQREEQDPPGTVMVRVSQPGGFALNRFPGAASLRGLAKNIPGQLKNTSFPATTF
ncbi:hypothetical protein DFH07DRAFT_780928 [Mycena maculata]|uniref:Uncharacterized protein n=1 Tax=Mycena maculata TaxID=230809 RepID=A0AAD7MTX6_9AGAR|nr:hypothetical protein DFH07DRAFT_780928 [Mycena maculata]